MFSNIIVLLNWTLSLNPLTLPMLLKYFILKEKIGAAGEVEGESELMNYIENYGQEENLRDDWTSTLL